MVLRAMAFHEKAGRSQGNSGFIVVLFFFAENSFSRPSSHCRHASIRTLEERIVSLGACWASSIQPVLPILALLYRRGASLLHCRSPLSLVLRAR